MRAIDWNTVKRWPTGHFNPHENVVVKRPRCRTSTIELESKFGTRDHVHVYRDGDQVYVLSVNFGLQYVGLARYDLSDAALGKLEPDKALEASAEVFVDRDYDIAETFGPRGVDLAPHTLIRRLYDHI